MFVVFLPVLTFIFPSFLHSGYIVIGLGLHTARLFTFIFDMAKSVLQPGHGAF